MHDSSNISNLEQADCLWHHCAMQRIDVFNEAQQLVQLVKYQEGTVMQPPDILHEQSSCSSPLWCCVSFVCTPCWLHCKHWAKQVMCWPCALYTMLLFVGIMLG